MGADKFSYPTHRDGRPSRPPCALCDIAKRIEWLAELLARGGDCFALFLKPARLPSSPEMAFAIEDQMLAGHGSSLSSEGDPISSSHTVTQALSFQSIFSSVCVGFFNFSITLIPF